MQLFFPVQDDWEKDQLLNFEKQVFDVLLYDNNYLIFLMLINVNHNNFRLRHQYSKLSIKTKQKINSCIFFLFFFSKIFTFPSDHDERRLRVGLVIFPGDVKDYQWLKKLLAFDLVELKHYRSFYFITYLKFKLIY